MELTWLVTYAVGNTYKHKEVIAKDNKEAIKKARIKNIKELEVKLFVVYDRGIQVAKCTSEETAIAAAGLWAGFCPDAFPNVAPGDVPKIEIEYSSEKLDMDLINCVIIHGSRYSITEDSYEIRR